MLARASLTRPAHLKHVSSKNWLVMLEEVVSRAREMFRKSHSDIQPKPHLKFGAHMCHDISQYMLQGSMAKLKHVTRLQKKHKTVYPILWHVLRQVHNMLEQFVQDFCNMLQPVYNMFQHFGQTTFIKRHEHRSCNYRWQNVQNESVPPFLQNFSIGDWKHFPLLSKNTKKHMGKYFVAGSHHSRQKATKIINIWVAYFCKKSHPFLKEGCKHVVKCCRHVVKHVVNML